MDRLGGEELWKDNHHHVEWRVQHFITRERLVDTKNSCILFIIECMTLERESTNFTKIIM